MQANKIATDELRQLALEDSTEEVGVLIQPSLDQPKVTVSKLNRGGVTINFPVGVEASPTEEDGSTERRVAEAAEFLKEVLGTAPHWLPAARSFVAKVTPQQLRIITESPSIEAVWPNRELRSSILSVASSP